MEHMQSLGNKNFGNRVISEKREMFDMSQVGLAISRARLQLGIAYQANCSSILASILIDPRLVKVLDVFSGY